MVHRYRRGPLLQEFIVKTLFDHGPMTVPTLVDRFNKGAHQCDARAVRVTLDGMVRQGRVMKVAHGVYGHGQQDVGVLAMIRNRTAAPFAFVADLLDSVPGFAKGDPVELKALIGKPHSYAVAAGYVRKLKSLGAVRQAKQYGWFQLTLSLIEEIAAGS